MKISKVMVVVLCMARVTFGQGSLAPLGAPAPAMKTLQQVEPRIDLSTVPGSSGIEHQITQSGSYYLSDNLVVSNSIGIIITASDVTLDLNGFRIIKTGGQSGQAIYVSGIRNITIKNGNIQEFEDGIYMYGSDGLYPTKGARLENINISRCTGYGLFVGAMSKVINCHFSEISGSAALFAAANSSIQNCTADNSSGGDGFHLLAGAKISDCSAINSRDDGFNASSNSIFNACTATDNGDDGFEVGSGASVTKCNASRNTGNGFNGNNESVFTDCIANYNAGFAGIYSVNKNKISGCVANYNDAFGIHVNAENVLSECTANFNGTGASSGIYVGENSVISKCTANENNARGISVNGDGSLLIDSVCSGNTDYGIILWDNNNRIEGCQMVTNGDYGISAYNTYGNFVARNTAIGHFTGNGYRLDATTNKVGTIQSSPVGAGPWDNFEF